MKAYKIQLWFYFTCELFLCIIFMRLSRNIRLHILQRTLFFSSHIYRYLYIDISIFISLSIYIYVQIYIHTCAYTHTQTHTLILNNILITPSSKWRITISVHINIILKYVFVFFFIPQGKIIYLVAHTIHRWYRCCVSIKPVLGINFHFTENG